MVVMIITTYIDCILIYCSAKPGYTSINSNETIWLVPILLHIKYGFSELCIYALCYCIYMYMQKSFMQ